MLLLYVDNLVLCGDLNVVFWTSLSWLLAPELVREDWTELCEGSGAALVVWCWLETAGSVFNM